MSIFGSMLREFEDPFFNGHREHIRRVEQMVENFMTPFDNMFGLGFGFPQLMAPAQDTTSSRSRQLTPFGFGRPMLPDIGSMFAGIQRMANDPNCHTYSSSSVYSYSMGQDGQPAVYQASSTTRSAPGGIKETRNTVCDSTSGVQSMSIGRHLGDKSHIVEKKRNRLTGEEEEEEEFINVDDSEESTFDVEWQRRTRPTDLGITQMQPRHSAPIEHRPVNLPLAITAGPSSERHSRKRDKDKINGIRGTGGVTRTSDKNRKAIYASKLKQMMKHPKHETN